MPEYLAPGVYVEETSFRSQSIEGVSTTTTAFVGPTRSGPTTGLLQVLTSLSDYEQTYGDGQQLDFTDASGMHNYMWHAARTFFEQGGRRLYVRRVYRADAAGGVASGRVDGATAAPAAGPAGLSITSSSPGQASNGAIVITLGAGPNVLAPVMVAGNPTPTVKGLVDRDVVWIESAPTSLPGSAPGFYLAHRSVASGHPVWTFEPQVAGSNPAPLALSSLQPNADPRKSAQIRVITATVTVASSTPGGLAQVWSGLPLDPTHTTAGAPDSLFDVFAAPGGQFASSAPITISAGGLTTGLDVLGGFAPGTVASLNTALATPAAVAPAQSPPVVVTLAGGSDGTRPTAAEYEGAPANPDDKPGLLAFEDIDEIAIVAAPGSTFGYEHGYRDNGATIMNHLIEHVQKMRYRVAVLDSGDGQSLAQVQSQRAIVDSEYAAMYYPWVTVLDPITQQEIELPPSGFVAGIYARNDIERAVYKAPANEVVLGALRFEKTINRGQQEVLNPLGINCFRFFEGRGYRLWGARTISSNSQWKYVNVRRYFAYLEHSIDKGTQWVVFEPNGEALWANVRRTIADFMFNEFQSGALLGAKPADAYFVRCDRTTMTQNDLDNGRLVCLIGVAPLYPAEFVIFRIGQWTAGSPAGSGL